MTNYMAKRKDTSWIPRAKELLEQGVSYRQVARQVGRDGKTVALHLPGYTAKRPAPAWHEPALRMLRDEQLSYHEVSRTLGIDRSHIARTFPGYGWTREQGNEYRDAKALMERTFIMGLDPNGKTPTTQPTWGEYAEL